MARFVVLGHVRKNWHSPLFCHKIQGDLLQIVFSDLHNCLMANKARCRTCDIKSIIWLWQCRHSRKSGNWQTFTTPLQNHKSIKLIRDDKMAIRFHVDCSFIYFVRCNISQLGWMLMFYVFAACRNSKQFHLAKHLSWTRNQQPEICNFLFERESERDETGIW